MFASAAGSFSAVTGSELIGDLAARQFWVGKYSSAGLVLSEQLVADLFRHFHGVDCPPAPATAPASPARHARKQSVGVSAPPPNRQQIEAACLRSLLASTADAAASTTAVRFGQICDCFGPFDAQLPGRVVDLLSQPWFLGDVPRDTAEQLVTLPGLSDGCFLVRFSSPPDRLGSDPWTFAATVKLQSYYSRHYRLHNFRGRFQFGDEPAAQSDSVIGLIKMFGYSLCKYPVPGAHRSTPWSHLFYTGSTVLPSLFSSSFPSPSRALTFQSSPVKPSDSSSSTSASSSSASSSSASSSSASSTSILYTAPGCSVNELNGGPAPPPPAAGCSGSQQHSGAHSGPCLRFFVVGDPGEPGSDRRRVAAAMRALQEQWISNGEVAASFVVSTGDNIYSNDVSSGAFDLLCKEVLDVAPPLPWIVALGNHDIETAKYRWHVERHGTKGEAGWEWICPRAAFALDDWFGQWQLRCGHGPLPLSVLLDMFVVNTNRMQKLFRRTLPDVAPGFYQTVSKKWWKQQKEALRGLLARPGGAWKLVVGHHPSEYVSLNYTEHNMFLARYFATTFMRGSRSTQKKRKGLAHIIRRGADLYLCGHQHLFSFMHLAVSAERPEDETRCRFAIVGASSTLDEPEESGSPHAADPDTPPPDMGSDSPHIPRFQREWKSPPAFGFTVVELEPHLATVRFFVLADAAAARQVYAHSWHRY